ncbi:response regulator (activator) in two-component regulatory system wtih UhpB [Catenovulum agarivorans DS-2]|uniref:Response regulator (Activator) in two-component regulatory system wtih UhpB n=1 Tax=Catenovulum agarivorans DS-2 TaxID=1328313 RepID=W7Q9R1_9ALTE|nr:response regulator transcription factor [Catenovulum agarivorans]EWH08721.1 response regulator (activator) in two-component regulatory system wtih UhpB [Catenovulum agarivorans DS-2]
MNIAIVEDHQLVLDGFSRLLTSEGYKVIAGFIDFHSALAQLPKTPADICIVDISLPDGNGINLVKQLSAKMPNCQFIMVSMYDYNPYISDALAAGVAGYLSKRVAAATLIDAIESVANGDNYLSADIQNKLEISSQQRPTQLTSLTEREFEAFICFARGFNPKQVASQLDMMPKTAHVHRANIMQKLKLRNQFSMLKIALEAGLISCNEIAMS